MSRIAVIPRIVLMGVLVLVGSSLPATAATTGRDWTSIGPQGGTILDLAVDPTRPAVVYAATYEGGVFKTANGGVSWSAANDGLGSFYVASLAINPDMPATLYAATEGGVFKTDDGASHWIAANTGLNEDMLPFVNVVAVNPVTPDTLYAGTAGLGIYRSIDAAATWQWVPACESECHIEALVVNPVTPTTVYAGGMDGAFKSTDGGDTWVPVNNGLNNGWVVALAVDPAAPSILYAALHTGGVFKSTDGAASWLPANTGLNGVSMVKDLAVDPAHPGTLYAATFGYYSGVYKSTDWAEHWTAVYENGGPNLVGNAVAVAPSAPDTVYAGFYDDYFDNAARSVGMARSTDGGATWTGINTGLTNTHVNLLAVHPLDPDTLYAGSESDGVFESTDGGATWAQRNAGLGDARVRSLVIDPLDPDTLYAATSGLGTFKSTDGAASWTRIVAGFGWATAREVALDPQTPTTLYATTGSQGMFKTVDGGANWTAANTGLTNQSTLSVAVDPISTTIVYVGTRGGGVFKSADAGASWAEANTGLECDFYGQPYEVLALAIDPVTPATVYAASSECGAFKSEDHGGHWSQISTGLPLDPDFTNEYLDVASLAIHPHTPSILYAGVSTPGWYYDPDLNGGVFKSVNGGESWSAVGGGLPRFVVNGVTLSPATDTLYAATTGGGVFAIQQVPTLVVNYSSGAPGSYFTFTGSDFPANQTATIGVNGHVLGTVPSDTSGNLAFLLRTHSTTQEGFYTVTASVTAIAMAHWTLDADLEVRPQEGSGPILDVPDGIAHRAVFVPLVVKQARMGARMP